MRICLCNTVTKKLSYESEMDCVSLQPGNHKMALCKSLSQQQCVDNTTNLQYMGHFHISYLAQIGSYWEAELFSLLPDSFTVHPCTLPPLA